MKQKKILIKIISLLLVLALFYLFLINFTDFNKDPYDTKFHVHADFKVFINGKSIDFSQEKYQTNENHSLSSKVHFHDGNGDIIHFHAEGVSLGEFLSTLQIGFNESCLSVENESFCVTDSTKLVTFVNGIKIVNPQFYVPNDLDKILIAYGNIDDDFTSLINQVTDDACIQSEKCPERGPPSDESSCAGDVCAFDIN